MDYKIGKSRNKDISECVKEVIADFVSPKIILFFSPADKFKEYARLIHEAFPESISMGCSALVTISRDGAFKDELLAVSLENGVQASAGVLKNVDAYPVVYSGNVKKCCDEVDTSSDTVCIEFTTGLEKGEEFVLSTLNSVLDRKNVPVFGGSAGNDGHDQVTYTALDGVVYPESAVFALIHNESGGIHFFRENIYKIAPGHELIATKVDIENRIVYEFDHRAAADVYARELDIFPDQIKDYMNFHPIGRVVGDDMFITDIKDVTAERGLSFYSRIYSNQHLRILEPDDYREVFKDTLKKISESVPEHSLVLFINCFSRTKYFTNEGFMQEYAEKLGERVGEFAGFSGYGEQLGHHNFNMTGIIAVFE